MSADDEIVIGLHERVIERQLAALLDDLDGLDATSSEIDAADAPHVLARHVAAHLADALSDADAAGRVDLVNRILAQLPGRRDTLVPGPRQLLSVHPTGAQPPIRPVTPLSDVALLTNSHRDPNLGAELSHELASADRVDLLCAFVKWSGIRLLERDLQALAARGVPFRILTTTYIGATDRKALDALAERFGAEVRVNYESHSTHLHAKAWLFYRNTGFDTGYIGSSNLSHTALVDGLEWNVRIARPSTPSLLEKFAATFDSYWNSPTFSPYDPHTDAGRLDDALRRARGETTRAGTHTSGTGIDTTLLEVRAYPHQQIMLDDLAAEREVHDRHRNLLVAATGTGKTVIAALDYARLCQAAAGPRPRLLFLAHRREILDQARRTYRDVLSDGSFGELFVDGQRPVLGTHVFASVQSLSRPAELARWAADAFDIIVIDEFHHAEAASYRCILTHFAPRELLGLTATPERADGVDVAEEFFAGRIASELRLWDALEADLLVPFHYFGIADNTDLTAITFRRGRYDAAELTELYTADDARVRIVLRALGDTVTDVAAIRALGFCVSVDHAAYMAERFTAAGILAAAITGDTPAGERAHRLQEFRGGELRCIFTVDLFNEGVDIPAIDTVLMLRPTQSATVFLQQLGRGLRRAPGKSVLTVLDFVGHQHTSFRFDLTLRALTGSSRRRLVRDVEQGFPFLPSGSQIVLDRQVEEEILTSLRATLDLSTRALVADVAAHRPAGASTVEYRLGTYLQEAQRSLADVYGRGGTRTYNGERRPRSWTALRDWASPAAEASVPDDAISPAEMALLARMRAFTHVDDPERISAYRRLLDAPLPGDAVVAGDPFAAMLFYQLHPTGAAREIPAGIRALRDMPRVRRELLELLEVCEAAARTRPLAMAGMDGIPLRSHARYTREELLAGLGQGILQPGVVPGNVREGVKWIPAVGTDALLVTLQKSEAEYSPTTLYKDYAISQELFHWESQNSTSPASATGRRYIEHRQQGSHVMLFVREAKDGDLGTQPYMCLGTAQYVSHTGEKPMQIVWRLDRPMPEELFVAARAVA